jgi:hypothetical protein
MPLSPKLRVTSSHARRVRVVDRAFGWLKNRLPRTQQVLGTLAAHDPISNCDLILLTIMAIHSAADAETMYTEWCSRPQIEHTCLFDQEDGLAVKDMRVQNLKRMRCVFVLVLLAALFAHHIAHARPKHMLLWLGHLGRKLGLSADQDGPYVLLAGISTIFLTASTVDLRRTPSLPQSPRNLWGVIIPRYATEVGKAESHPTVALRHCNSRRSGWRGVLTEAMCL